MKQESKHIPQQLKDLPRWLCWRTEERDGKPTKVPYTPSGRSASSTDSATWTEYETAAQAVKDFDGIGIALGDNLTGVDLDKCRDADTGDIEPWAEAVIEQLNSYTEISPSGNGVHIYCLGDLPEGQRRKGQLEMYSDGRYFTVTGHHLEGTPTTVRPRPQALGDLHKQTFGKPQARAPAPVSPGTSLSDQELLKRMFAAANGPAVQALWGGNWKGRYPSQNEADQALVNHLAFWWGGDRAAIDRMFRRSSLTREKWEKRADYRERTINKALAGMTEFYKPPKAQPEPGSAKDKPPMEVHLTDTGNALRFMTQHKGNIRYCEPWKSWVKWGGQLWQRDAETQAMRLAKATVCDMYNEAGNTQNDTKRKALTTHALKCESAQRRKAMVYLAQFEPELSCEPNIFDQDPMLFNCANGTIDLHTGQLRRHRRLDYITKMAPVNYDVTATCPKWLTFLDSIFAGNSAVIDFMQRVIGYCLTGSVKEDALIFDYGSGSNGKSTFNLTLQSVLGDYAIEVSPNILLKRYRRESETAPGLMKLFKVRMAVCEEVGSGRRFDEERLKNLTGGKPIVGRSLWENEWEFLPTHKLLLAANEKPEVIGQDYAFWRRIYLVPFTVKFTPAGEPGPDIDKSLRENLFADEWPGILQWALEGCVSWQAEGLAPPPEVRAATKEYKAEQDVVQQFIDDECEIGPELKETSARLHKAYERWRKETGAAKLSLIAFGVRLSGDPLNFERISIRDGKDVHKGRAGIALRKQPELDWEGDI